MQPLVKRRKGFEKVLRNFNGRKGHAQSVMLKSKTGNQS